MKRYNIFSFVVCSILMLSCSGPKQMELESISAIVVDSTGEPLPQYALQVIDVNESWLSVPLQHAEGSKDSAALLYPESYPVILKFSAPGYLSAYAFITDAPESLELEVHLRSIPLMSEPIPAVIGDFNEFDTRSAVEMKEQENGTWYVEIETDPDTINYLITGYTLGSIAGTDGEYSLNKKAPTFDRTYYSKLVKVDDEDSFKVTFDPGAFMFNRQESHIIINGSISDEVVAVSEIFTRMTNEYLDYLFSNMLYQMRGELYEHNFTNYTDFLNAYSQESISTEVRSAAIIAKLRFSRDISVSPDDLNFLFENLPADAPTWMIDFTTLTGAASSIGRRQVCEYLEELAKNSPFESLRAEALYNLVRYHHNEGNKTEWHAAFFDFVSNHPNYFRTGSAYQNYAPEQPINVGSRLPYNEFSRLENEEPFHLEELDEPYVLIDFWATWCGPCISAMPKLHNLYETYKDWGFTILSISMDQSPRHVESFRNEWEMPWHHAFEGYRSNRTLEMGVVGIPFYVLLGPDRTVITHDQQLLRSDNFTEFLESHLLDN
jgi:thiol-disulfide isomerase/thioredoxin